METAQLGEKEKGKMCPPARKAERPRRENRSERTARYQSKADLSGVTLKFLKVCVAEIGCEENVLSQCDAVLIRPGLQYYRRSREDVTLKESHGTPPRHIPTRAQGLTPGRSLICAVQPVEISSDVL